MLSLSSQAAALPPAHPLGGGSWLGDTADVPARSCWLLTQPAEAFCPSVSGAEATNLAFLLQKDVLCSTGIIRITD